MAYKAGSLTKISNLLGPDDLTSPTPGLFYYVTTDTITTLLGAGYFNTATTVALVGSIIQTVCAEGLKHLKVSAVSGAGVVTVVDLSSSAVAEGQATTVTASDTIVTGLGALKTVVVSLNDNPVAGCTFATGSLGDQAGAPAAGSFLLNTWNDAAPAVAATTFGKKVNWIAYAL
jgi:hypothetical protein